MNEAATAVRWLLQQAEPEARRVAVRQIAKVRGREAPELLLRALGDDDWRVRKEATLVAPGLEHREEVVASLVAALEDTVNIGLRNAAVEALVAIGPDAVSATIDALARLDADARKLAVEVLGGVPDARGTAALSRALHDEDANVRVTAAEALGKAALAGEESRDPGDGVARRGARHERRVPQDGGARLARAPGGAPSVEPLRSLRGRSPAAPVRDRRSRGLPRAATAVRALALATGDPSPTIAREALVSLGEVIAGGSRTTHDLLDVRARGPRIERSGPSRRPTCGAGRRGSAGARWRRSSYSGSSATIRT